MKHEIQKLLTEYNITPNKVLGQNFLIDKKYVINLIDVAEISKVDTVVEVGPGTGEITKELAKRAGRVIAIEKDARLVPLLKETLVKFDNVEIIEGDILKFSISNFPSHRLVSLRLKTKSYKLVGAIPYYLTARLFRKFLEELEITPKLIAIITQEGVAERITAKPPKNNLLAISIQLYGEAELEKRIPAGAFWPKPKINSAILTLKDIKKPKIDEKTFFRVLKASFSSPRKQLAVNLVRELKIPRSDIGNLLKNTKISPHARAETLKLEDWLKLVSKLAKLVEK